MLKQYTVFFRDPLAVVRSIVSNPDFNGKFAYAPYKEFEDENRRWQDLMSGEWAWKQAVSLFSLQIPLVLCANSVYLGYYQQGPQHTWINDDPINPWQ